MKRAVRWASVAVVAAVALVAARQSLRRSPPRPAPPPPGRDLSGDPLPPFAVARMGTVRRPTATCGLAFSPDGRALVCGCSDGVVRRFDVGSGALLAEERVRGGFETIPRVRGPWSWLTDAFGDDRDEVVADLPWRVAFAADGARTATAGGGSVTLTDASGTRRARRAGTQPVALSFAPTGSALAVGWSDGRIDLDWPSSTAVSLSSGAQGMAFSPYGRYLAVQAQGVHLIDLATGREVRTAPSKDFAPGGIAFSPDGSRLAHAQGRGGLVLRDAATFDVVWEASQPGRLNWGEVRFSPDGRSIAWGLNGVAIVDAATGAVSHVLETGTAGTSNLAFAPDGSRLAASVAGVVRVWDTANWTELTPAAPPLGAVHEVEFSPDGRSILSRGFGNSLDVWDAATGALRTSLAVSGHVSDSAWTPDGATVRCASHAAESTELLTFDAATGSKRDSVVCPKYSKFVLRGAAPMLFRFESTTPGTGTWDLADPRTGASLRTLPGGTMGGISTQSRDGRYLAMTTGSPPLEILDFATGSRVASEVGWPRSDGIARLVAMSHDASFVAVAAEHGRVVVAERAGGSTLLSADSGLHGAATSLAVSPDGRLVAVGDPFGAVHVWSTDVDAELAALAAHRGIVWALDFSPDGSRLASGGDDATVLVWDVSAFASAR